jgi:hypothetical protein
MTSTSDDYWDIDGTSLMTYARGIETLGGSMSGVTQFRGDDTKLALRRGARHRIKVADSRVITLAGWFLGVPTEDGDDPAGLTEANFWAKWNEFKYMIWKPGGGTFELTKRWTDPDDTQHEATAIGQYESGLDLVRIGRTGGKFTVDIRLADPFFYEDFDDFDVAEGATETFANGGADSPKMTIDFIGPLTNPQLTNSTPDPDVWVKLGMVIGSGETVTVDVEEGTVINDSDENVIGALSHAGAASWFYLFRGNNSVNLDADSGAGSVTINHQIAHL